MKFNLETKEVKRNGKTYIEYVTAQKQLETFTNSKNIKLNIETVRKNDNVMISNKGIFLYPDFDGIVSDEVLEILKNDEALLTDFVSKLNDWDWFFIESLSALKAYVYIAKHYTDDWSKSPYSNSFYSDKNIDWGHKPEGSLRVSDHWNFVARDDQLHCKTDVKTDGWAVCEYKNGIYHLIEKF